MGRSGEDLAARTETGIKLAVGRESCHGDSAGASVDVGSICYASRDEAPIGQHNQSCDGLVCDRRIHGLFERPAAAEGWVCRATGGESGKVKRRIGIRLIGPVGVVRVAAVGEAHVHCPPYNNLETRRVFLGRDRLNRDCVKPSGLPIWENGRSAEMSDHQATVAKRRINTAVGIKPCEPGKGHFSDRRGGMPASSQDNLPIFLQGNPGL